MNYVIKGIVVRGDGYGRKIGFPTINLALGAKEFPPEGIYAGEALLDGKKYCAGVIIGPGDKIEAHLIGYSGNAYGQNATLSIKQFLRKFKKFEAEEELISQIKKDIKLITKS